MGLQFWRSNLRGYQNRLPRHHESPVLVEDQGMHADASEHNRTALRNALEMHYRDSPGWVAGVSFIVHFIHPGN